MRRPKSGQAHFRLQHQRIEHYSGLRQRLCSLHLKGVSGRQLAFREISAKMNSERVKELERQIAELKSRWPAHSVPPAMLQQLEDLEEELERELEKTAGGETDAQADGSGGLS